MSNNRDLVKVFLLSVFSRYKRGNATRTEQKLVEKFFEQIKPEDNNLTESQLREIKSHMKQEIDLHLDKNQQVRYPFRKLFIPAAAAVLIIFLTFSDTGSWRGCTDSSSLAFNAVSEGPTLSLGTVHFDNLLDSLPKQARYRSLKDEQVLDLSDVQSSNDADSLIITNPTKANFTVLLPDGTLARLASQARIAYLWDQRSPIRKLHMQGKMTFDVAKIDRKGDRIPFYVETDIQQIAVLGTVFTVDANSVVEHSVHLHEGSVQLSHHISQDKVLLRPGQKAFAARDNPRIYVATPAGDKQKLLAWRKQQFYFDDQRLIDVMKELSEWYGREISVEKAAYDLPITGIVSRYKRIEDIIEIIKMTNTITYYEKKGVIYVGLK